MTVQAQDQTRDINTIRNIAAEWLLQLEEAEPQQRAAVKSKLADWLTEDTQHQAVFSQMQQMWEAIDPQESVDSVQGWQRSLAIFSLVLLTVCLLYSLPWSYWQADYHTATGQIATINLPDGSTATLNTRSAINVDYSGDTRTITLLRGEVQVDVRRDEQRSRFQVKTAHGSAAALGTRYTVRLEDKQTYVSVQESDVLLTPRHGESPPLTLSTGLQTRFDSTAVQAPQIADPYSTAWVKQQLIFNDATLAKVVDQLNRYHRGLILLDRDGQLKSLRFTGALPTQDHEVALGLLAETLQLQVKTLSPYLIWLEPDEKN